MGSKEVFAICVMAFVTYLIRLLPIALVQKKIENPFLRSFLAYVPYAVLTALTFPAILYSYKASQITLSTILGCAVALFLSYHNKSCDWSGFNGVCCGKYCFADLLSLLVKGGRG